MKYRPRQPRQFINKQEEKVHEVLAQTGYFNLSSAVLYDTGIYSVYARPKIVIVQPLTYEAEMSLKANPYIRTLTYKDYYFALFWFPDVIEDIREGLSKNTDLKFISRLNKLFSARDKGQVKLWKAIEIPLDDFSKLTFTAKPYNREEHDFKDDEEDTTCTKLDVELKTFETIEKVSLTYNTCLLLQNAKVSKNKALFYYKDTKVFYTDCILNYILEHGKIIAPENFRYGTRILEVRMPVKELKKLMPHRTFKLEAPEGVTITYKQDREKVTRLSKNDTAIFQFSFEYISKFKEIITRASENVEAPLSFVKIPMFFVLQALKQENLTAGGFKFLLWLIPFFRMKSPKILHSIKKILIETGMDIRHGYQKPLITLSGYFEYLRKVNMLSGVDEPIIYTKPDLNEPPKYKGNYIELKKPKLS